MTVRASQTKTPPIIKSNSSFFNNTAKVPKAAPEDKEPVSPIKTSAGWELYHKYPMQAPAIAELKIASSPAPGRYRIFK